MEEEEYNFLFILLDNALVVAQYIYICHEHKEEICEILLET